jgi:cell division protein YceG involved in septum cleavage
LYFVSRNDGSHAFASTLQAHNRNVQEWQIDYFRRKKNH